MVTVIDQMAGNEMPPVVPTTVKKSQGFNFLPPGTEMLADATKWALYYYSPANVSYLVMDAGKVWRIKPILGKVRVGYAKSVMAQKPCCGED